MKWRRLMAGSYEADTEHGKYEIYLDPSVAGAWDGPSWVAYLKRFPLDEPIHSCGRLREAKAECERHFAHRQLCASHKQEPR